LLLVAEVTMNARAEQKQRSHEEILRSATRLFRSRGINAASVGEVMRGAGLTVGGFYAHFPSKEALLEEALRRALGSMRERLLAHIDETPAADRAALLLRRYLSRSHREDREDGCPLPAMMSELAAQGDSVRGTLASELEACALAFAPHLPDACDAPPRERALALLCLMYGGLAVSRAVGAGPLSDEILRACRSFGLAALRGPAPHIPGGM
jgi:TetR/AcrR family transcriptional repressor of nem operon